MKGRHITIKMEGSKNNREQFLILVDEKDRAWGQLEKMEVHQLGLLHRAFSVFIFNSKGELLMQQRAEDKYHSASLWSNTCCSHPQFGEDLKDAVNRRLLEELGLTVETEFLFSFIYKIKFGNGLTEHEFDHVFFGISDRKPSPDPTEIKNIKYMSPEELDTDLEANPQHYSEWLRLCFKDILQNEKIQQLINSETGKSPDHL
jgi:isopentenyl-diphosphate Delta-isomerase